MKRPSGGSGAIVAATPNLKNCYLCCVRQKEEKTHWYAVMLILISTKLILVIPFIRRFTQQTHHGYGSRYMRSVDLSDLGEVRLTSRR